MSMTRKEFNIASDQLRELPEDKTFTKEDVVQEFIKFLRQTNPRFDAQRFAAACRHPASTFGAEDSQ